MRINNLFVIAFVGWCGNLYGQACPGDLTPPVILGCPQDIYIDVSENVACDTTVFWVPPITQDDCELVHFEHYFDFANWTLDINGPGGGSNGNAMINTSLDTLSIWATDDGTAPDNTNTDFCITLTDGGILGFEWFADAIGGGMLLVNDEPAIVVNGVETILVTGPIASATGVAMIPLEAGDTFCFRVRSNNQGARTHFQVNDFWYQPEATIVQTEGPQPDSTPGAGDGDLVGTDVHRVTYVATDAAGNTSQCSFLLHVEGTQQLVCKDINVSLDENCGVRVVPSMVLKGSYPCIEGFEVVLSHHGVVIGDSIDLTYLGEILDFEVLDPGSGNRCWGQIKVEDKFDPQIVCLNDTMSCIEFQFVVDTPEVTEHCQQYQIVLVDDQVTNYDCDDQFVKFITRRWVAIDESGNVSDTCEQGIWIERFPMGDVQGPIQDTTLYCGSGYDKNAEGYPSPEVTGTPTLYGIPLWPLPDYFCNILSGYKDIPMVKKGCTLRFLRQWEVQEWWCRSDSTRRFSQIIEVVDTVGPVIELDVDTLYGLAGQRSCDALVDIPRANIYDVCHSVDHVDMVYPGGFTGGQNGGLIRLPVGFNDVVFRAYDSCYNMSTDTLVVHVTDRVAPVAVCEQNTVVTLGISGVSNVLAEVFDDGSFDECQLDRMEVRRMNDPCGTGTDEWGGSVDFCCADIGTEVMVAFRVTDISGNENTCMVRVSVQDKQPPRILPLPNIELDCRYDWNVSHLEVFGSYVSDPALRDSIWIDAEHVVFDGDPLDGLIIDNCPPVVHEEMDTSHLNQCGIGHLIRTFTIMDLQGNKLVTSQVITFVSVDTFSEDQILWPAHLDTSNVCGVDNFNPALLPSAYGFPTFVNEDECSLVGYDYKDEVIDASRGSEACFKIIRHWTVIDWCQTVGNIHQKWYYDQVIEVQNTEGPIIVSPCLDTVRCVISATCTPDTFVLQAEAIDSCTAQEDLFWTYKIDLLNDGTFDIVGHDNDATGLYPFGQHRIKWLVEDLCGNLDTCEYMFELRNCKAPTAYCRNGLIAELTPLDVTGDTIPDIEIDTVWARDFDEGSYHICGHPVTLSFSVDTNDVYRVYDCDSLFPPRRDVTIWVTDRVTGETGRCRTFVFVQDNNSVAVCTNFGGTVSGLVSTSKNHMIKDAEIYLNIASQKMEMTDDHGAYVFKDLQQGEIYEIIPQKLDKPMNGVSTADLVRIQRHLLGTDLITTPYELIAADVNNSGNVSTSDISELRKMILGVYGDFPNNTSWRFVDNAYRFPNPINPWQESFPEHYRIEPLSRDMNIDFIGIKVGDVTGDVVSNGQGSVNKARSSFDIVLRNVKYDEGEVIEIPIIVDALEALSAVQLTIEWDRDRLEWLDVIPNYGIDMDPSNYGLQLVDEGMLSLAWFTTRKFNVPTDALKNLGVLKFRALKSGVTDRNIMLSDRMTVGRAYTHDDLHTPLIPRLLIGSEVQEGHFALYQNVPNPWSEQTIISFTLPTSTQITLSIYDENGRAVRVVEGNYEKGYNEITIDKSKLNNGVYYYRLATMDQVATRKMIVW